MVISSNNGAVCTSQINSVQKNVNESILSLLVKTLAIFLLVGFVVSCGGGGGSAGSANVSSDGVDTTTVPENTISYPDFPTKVKLVSVFSTDAGAITVDWLPAEDAQTTHRNMSYIVHVSEKENFVPSQATVAVTVTGAISTTVNSLKTAVRYYIAVVARDESGNESWSNQLDVATVSTVMSRTNAVVLAQKDGAVQSVTDKQVVFDEASGVPAVGDIIAGTKNGGYLRKVTQVSTDSGQVTVQTDPASLNEVFDEFEFSTSVKLGDFSNQTLSTPSKLALHASKIPGGGNKLSWPSGLTVIDSAPAVQKSAASLSLFAKPAHSNVEFVGDEQKVFWEANGDKYQVTAPAYSFIQPDNELNFPVSAIVIPGSENKDTGGINTQICKIELEEFEHKDEDKNSLPKPLGGNNIWRERGSEGNPYLADYHFSWRPTAAHVHDGSLPYNATFKVYIRKISSDCSVAPSYLNKAFDAVKDVDWEDVMEVTVPIYVGKEQSPNINDQKKTISFTGEVNVTNVVTMNFEPEFDISAKLSRIELGILGLELPTISLESAKIAVQSDMSLINELTITADGEGVIDPQPKNLFTSKKFIKIFTVGAVPILVSGEFSVRVKVDGYATGKISLKKTVEFALSDTELGMKYSRASTPRWDSIGKKGYPTYSFELKGDGEATAHIKLTLIPDFQIHFYDTASGRILLEPYIYGDTAIQGHFIYRDDGVAGSDIDYWFDELVAGAGLDLKLFAGLSVFERNLASYPDNTSINQIDNFVQIQVIEKTPIWSLPTLVATQSAANDALDSRSILITGVATDTPVPLLQKITSLNPFERWTIPKVLENELMVEDGRAVLQLVTVDEGNSTVTVPGQYHFVYTQPGDYNIRLFGHSEAGPFFRQMTELDISLTDIDGDGMIDQWETEYGVENPEDDPDGDGFSNLQEFQMGTNPKIKNDFSNDGDSTNSPDTTIRSVACSAPVVGEVMVCSILGTNLSELTQLEASNCNPSPMDAVAGGNDTQRQFTCTPLTVGLLVDVDYIVPGFIGTLPRVSPVVASVPPTVTSGGKLNDTGVTASQCYAAGNNDLVSCTSAAALSLNDRQDGMIGFDVTQNDDANGAAGFSYSLVSKPGSGFYDSSECIKDERAGLIWESKTSDGGLRDYRNTYMHIFNPDFPDIGTTITSDSYVKKVNQLALCGFTDWRLPRSGELQGLIDYSDRVENVLQPTIDLQWFSNTLGRDTNYATSTRSVINNSPWYISFRYGGVFTSGLDHVGNTAIRLVRSAQPVIDDSNRYSVSSDGTEVTDSITSLVWRRCPEGMTYLSGACLGENNGFSHEEALKRAKLESSRTGEGWRLPNVKELSSIIDYSFAKPAINESLFPSTPSYYHWTSSPLYFNTQGAWTVQFSDGEVASIARFEGGVVRLVRDSNGGGSAGLSTITSFTSDGVSISAGSSINLTAIFANGSGVIDKGVGIIGSGFPVTVSPVVTTTYTLTVTSTAGVAITQSVTIIVSSSPGLNGSAVTLTGSGVSYLSGGLGGFTATRYYFEENEGLAEGFDVTGGDSIWEDENGNQIVIESYVVDSSADLVRSVYVHYPGVGLWVSDPAGITISDDGVFILTNVNFNIGGLFGSIFDSDDPPETFLVGNGRLERP